MESQAHKTDSIYAEELARIHQQGTSFMRRLGYLAAVVLLSMSFVTGWALYSRFNQTNDLRAAQARNRINQARIWHAVICDIEATILKSKTIKPSSKEANIMFYDQLLIRDARSTSCGIKVGNHPPATSVTTGVK